ncbi:hypothetical protein WHR41_04669 [Cladosporium halotolerans]|uniref:NmrA-like domain-containing protein n=1 Tax=Cladosporium halotolerans TaxID=1052096 RepID=A0AB34KRL5_9PEZI
MTMEKKIVAVLGATGQQGGSVVQSLLADPEKYHIRGLTRDINSNKSKGLAAQGVEVVQADVGDAISLERAFEGAHSIYAMTDFWQSMSADVETEQGKAIANIANGLPQLEHFVWASLPDGRALSAGKYSNIFHWQSKAAVAKYIRDSKPRLWGKTIEILFPNYFENCVTNPGVYLPREQSDGTYLRSFCLNGKTSLPNAAISDTGKLVKYLIECGYEYHKRTIAFNSQSIGEIDKLKVLESAYGISVRYEQTSEKVFRESLEAKMGPVTALDFTEQLMIFEGTGMIYDDSAFVQASKLPGLKLKTWEDFVQENNLLSLMQED